MTEPVLPPLRERLLVLRNSVLDAMENAPIESGFLPTLAGIGAALEALDARGGETADEGVDRVVVTNDGREIRLTLYRNGESEAIVSVTLEPVYALTIAGKLLDGARSHLCQRLRDA